MAVDYAFIADLDDSKVTAALGRIDAKMTTLADTMSSVFIPLDKSKASFSKMETAGKNAISAIRAETNLLKKDLSSLGNQLSGINVKPTGTVDTSSNRGKDILSQELQRGTQSQDGRDFIQQSSRQAGDAGELERIVSLSDQLSESQIKLASRTASAREEVERLTSRMTNGAELSEDAMSELRQELRRVQAVVEEGDVATSTNRARDAIEKAEKATSDWVKELRKFDDTGDEIGRVTSDVKKLNTELAKSGKNTDDIDKVTKNANDQIKIIERLSKARLRSQQIAERSLKAQIKSIPEVKNKLAELADKYNGLIIPMGKVTNELTDQQKEVRDLINSDERLAKVVDDLTKETGEFNLELKRTDFKKSSDGMKGMSSVLDGFGKLLKGGIILAGLREIARVALRMAEDVTRAFFDMTTDAVQFADQQKGQVITFQNVLKTDDPEVAERLLNKMQGLSIEFGVDTASIASAFLPFVDQFDDLDGIVQNAVEILALSTIGGDPKGMENVLRALSEMFSEKKVRSFVQQFEVSYQEANSILKAMEDAGGSIVAGSEALHAVLTNRGIDYETLQELVSIQQGKLAESVRLLKAGYGDAVNERYSDFLQRINEFLAENADGIEIIVRRLGEFVTEIGNLGASGIEDFIESVDLGEVDQSIGKFINTLKSSKLALDEFLEFFSELLVFIRDTNILTPIVESLFDTDTWEEVNIRLGLHARGWSDVKIAAALANDEVDQFKDKKLFDTEVAGRSFTQLFGLIKAGLAGTISQFGILSKAVESVFSGDFDAKALLLESHTAYGEAFNDSIRGTIGLLDSMDGRKVVAEIEVNTDDPTDKDSADFFLKNLVDSIAETNDEIIAAQKLVDQELYNVQQENITASLQLQKDHADAQIALQLDLHREIAKMKRKHLDDLKKLADDAGEDGEDLTLKHSRKLEDIENKRSNDELKAAIDNAKKKVDIEEDYLRKLGELRRQFQFSANEAIRQNDAVAFLQLKRKFEFDQNEARIAKEQKDADTDSDASDTIQKIKDAAEEARQAEKLAHERSEEDLRTSQDRKLKALQDAWKIEKREFRFKEEERRLDLAKRLVDELTEHIKNGRAKLDSIKQRMDDEFTTISTGHDDILAMEAEKYKLERSLAEKHVQSMLNIFKKMPTSEGTLGGYLNGGNNPFGGTSSPSESGGSGGRGTSAIQGMRDGAISVARDRGVLDAYLSRITASFESNDSAKLQQLIAELNKLPRREFGGSVKKGQPYITGERGMELFVPQENGTIIPNNFASLLNKQSQATQATFPSFNSGGGVDNSKTYNTDVSLLDPTGFSQGQISILSDIIRQVILEATVNV